MVFEYWREPLDETVFVKPILNHSATRISLAWEIKELLDIVKMKDTRECYTTDAGITFKHNDKFYAVRDGTGNLPKECRKLGFAAQREGI